jgi:hypothetical protein
MTGTAAAGCAVDMAMGPFLRSGPRSLADDLSKRPAARPHDQDNIADLFTFIRSG